jgi:hypothetical protein
MPSKFDPHVRLIESRLAAEPQLTAIVVGSPNSIPNQFRAARYWSLAQGRRAPFDR